MISPDNRDRIASIAKFGVPAVVLVLIAVGIWRLASDTAGERREAPQTAVVALTPPPPAQPSNSTSGNSLVRRSSRS